MTVNYASGDFEPDGDVDFVDFAVLADAWNSELGDANWNAICDISAIADSVIDELDLIDSCLRRNDIGRLPRRSSTSSQ